MKLGPYDLNTIVTGDARILAKDIPDNSVDLILTDPEYQNIDDYYWLAEMAVRVLKDNRPCLAFCGIGYLPETHDALRAGGLTYRWRLVIKPVWKLEFHGKLLVGSQECLWYEKGRSRLFQSQLDVQMSTKRGNYNVAGSNWGKSPQVLGRYINAFSQPNAVVFDPFTGMGTVPAVCKMLGRNYIAFELDPDVAQLARDRVRDTQPPLPLVMPEQLAFRTT